MALMTLVEARPVSLSSTPIVKMEERKRPASYDHDDAAPPLKRQATSANGAGKVHPDAEMPWKDELEVSPSFLEIALRSNSTYPLLLNATASTCILIPGAVCAAISEGCNLAADAGV